MKPSQAQEIKRLMAPRAQLFQGLTKAQILFDGNVDAIGEYIRTTKLFVNDRVRSKCFYGPVIDENDKPVVIKKRLGYHIHYTLHWQFT